MRKRIIFALVAAALLAGGAMSASAQLRLEGDLNWPIVAGLRLEGMGMDQDMSTAIGNYHLIVPDVQVYWQFGGDLLRLGIGLRAFTILIESFGYPSAFVELNLKPIALNFSFGGFAFFAFGLANSFGTGSVALFDLNASWQLSNWFRLGAGLFGLAPFEYLPGNFGYVFYIGAKFVGIFS